MSDDSLYVDIPRWRWLFHEALFPTCAVCCPRDEESYGDCSGRWRSEVAHWLCAMLSPVRRFVLPRAPEGYVQTAISCGGSGRPCQIFGKAR